MDGNGLLNGGVGEQGAVALQLREQLVAFLDSQKTALRGFRLGAASAVCRSCAA